MHHTIAVKMPERGDRMAMEMLPKKHNGNEQNGGTAIQMQTIYSRRCSGDFSQISMRQATTTRLNNKQKLKGKGQGTRTRTRPHLVFVFRTA